MEEEQDMNLRDALLERKGREKDENVENTLHRKLVEEQRKLWRVAGPAIFTRFSTFGVTVISQAFIGHISATDLAAFALVQTVLLRFTNGILLTSLKMRSWKEGFSLWFIHIFFIFIICSRWTTSNTLDIEIDILKSPADLAFLYGHKICSYGTIAQEVPRQGAKI